jgi:SAM-dependent methyltransferase
VAAFYEKQRRHLPTTCRARDDLCARLVVAPDGLAMVTHVRPERAPASAAPRKPARPGPFSRAGFFVSTIQNHRRWKRARLPKRLDFQQKSPPPPPPCREANPTTIFIIIMSLLLSSDSLTSHSGAEHHSVPFFGRALEEYAQFFSLDPAADLRGRAVLDVAAGPSSFTAEACALGCDAVAVDPLYGRSADALATYVAIDYREVFARLRARPSLARFRAFASVNEAEARRRAAAARFLHDYAERFVLGRYAGAELPELPFADGAFDLVLCAHFLFQHEARFDFAFHVAACRELARVSRGEARVHPVSGPGGKTYPKLGDLLEELARLGVAGGLRESGDGLATGEDAMLVLRRAE